MVFRRVLSLLWLFLCLGQGHAQVVPAASNSGPKPNFVLILADDLGYGDLSCYGGSIDTPHLDAMAARGVRFTQFQTTFPACAPSRTALLTGRYHFRAGMFGNPTPDAPHVPGADKLGIPNDEVLLSEALWASGYATGMIGKWHLGHQPEFYPTRHGFEEYFGILYSNDMRPVQLFENEEVVDEFPVVQATLTERYTRRAEAYIERNASRPFFLYLAHAMPHKPLAASEEFYTPDTPGDLYADTVRELDASVGRVLAKIRREGLAERTLVVFTSDNGPWFGGSTAGLRGMKASTFEGGIRVPCIATFPGRVAEGRTCDAATSMMDWFPTFLNMATPLPPVSAPLDGRDLAPLLQDPSGASPHDALFAFRGSSVGTVRQGKWKLHVLKPSPGHPYAFQGKEWLDPRGPDGSTILAPMEQPGPDQFPGAKEGDVPVAGMLFDLDADPNETRNVADKHPERVAEMRRLAGLLNAEAELVRGR